MRSDGFSEKMCRIDQFSLYNSSTKAHHNQPSGKNPVFTLKGLLKLFFITLYEISNTNLHAKIL